MNRLNTYRSRIAAILIFALVIHSGIPVRAAQIRVTDTGAAVSANNDTGSGPVNITIDPTASDNFSTDKTTALTPAPVKKPEPDTAAINITKPAATPTPAAASTAASTAAPTAAKAPETKQTEKPATIPSSSALSDKEDRASGGGSKFSIKKLGSGLLSLLGSSDDEPERNGAPGDTVWQDDFNYSTVSKDGIDYIELSSIKTTSLNRADLEEKAVIDGKEYITRLTADHIQLFRGNQSIESVSINNIDISDVTDLSYMFTGCSNLQNVDISALNTSNVQKMSSMFNGCRRLTDLNMGNIDTSAVTDMSGMFSGCQLLTSVDISGFDTGKVKYMTDMFNGCSGLTDIIMSGIDTSKLTDIGGMFGGCSSLTELNLSGLDMSRVQGMASVFSGCSNLESLNLDFLGEIKPADTIYLFKGCSSLSSLDLSKFNLENLRRLTDMLNGCDSLLTIEIPINLSGNVVLPDEFVKASDRTISYQSLPEGETESFTIIKGQAYVSVNEITLSGNSGSGPLADDKITVFTGETVTLYANAAPDGATNKDVTWSLKKPASGGAGFSYVSDNRTLTFTGISPGEVTVRAESEDGPYAQCLVKVINDTSRVTAITLDKTNVPALEKKRDTDLTATVEPDTADNLKVNWSVVPVRGSNVVELSDPDEDDNRSTVTVTGHNEGEVRIVARSDDNENVVSECRIRVVKTKVTKITILSDNHTINVNNTLQLKEGEDYIKLPDDAKEVGIKFSSSNTRVADVDENGLITGKGDGRAVITITADQDDPKVSAEVIINVKSVPVTSINLIPQDQFLYTGYTYNKFRVIIEPDEPTDRRLKWESTDDNVATVDQNGKVTARGEGECDIIVSTLDGSNLSSRCHFTVEDLKKRVVSITLIQPAEPILKGDTIGISYIITPDDATDQTLFWESSDESIATVDENGKVTGVSPGRAKITVRTQDGGHTDFCWVEVASRPVEVTRILLNPTSYQMYVTQKEKITATVLPENAVDKSITWRSNNEAVAVVSQTGEVTAMGLGDAEITAEASNGVKAICYIKVIRLPVRVEDIYVTPVKKTIYVGQGFNITATITPADADVKDIMWSSDNEKIATVNSKGRVTGKKKGTATITAVTADGGFSATCEVTVKNKPIDPVPEPTPWPTPSPSPDDKDRNKIRIVDERTKDAPHKDKVRAYLDRVPGDWYLIITDSDGATIKPRIYGDSSLMHNRAVFFKIRVLDAAGNEVKDFGKFTIRIPLIPEMDIKNGTIRVVAVNGDGLDKSISSSTGSDGDMYYVTFTANHNGEYAILYTLNQPVIDYYNNYYRALANQYNAANAGQIRVLDHIPRTGYGDYDKEAPAD